MNTLILLAFALSTAGSESEIHKCTVDGRVTYSQMPCDRGLSSVLKVPDAPAPDAGAKADWTRQQKMSRDMQTEREKREARQSRDDEVSDKAAAIRRGKCKKLRQDQKWAEEDARGALLQQVERAQLKARRAAERYKLECGS